MPSDEYHVQLISWVHMRIFVRSISLFFTLVTRLCIYIYVYKIISVILILTRKGPKRHSFIGWEILCLVNDVGTTAVICSGEGVGPWVPLQPYRTDVVCAVEGRWLLLVQLHRGCAELVGLPCVPAGAADWTWEFCILHSWKCTNISQTSITYTCVD